jgi:hypothetical protein
MLGTNPYTAKQGTTIQAAESGWGTNNSSLHSQMAIATELYIFLGSVSIEVRNFGETICKMTKLCSRLVNAGDIEKDQLREGLIKLHGINGETAELLADLAWRLQQLLLDLSDTEFFLPGVSPVFSLGTLSSAANSENSGKDILAFKESHRSHYHKLQNRSLSYAEDLSTQLERLRQKQPNRELIRRLCAESAITILLADRLEDPRAAATVLVYGFGTNDATRKRWVRKMDIANVHKTQIQDYRKLEDLLEATIISKDTVLKYVSKDSESQNFLSFKQLREIIQFEDKNIGQGSAPGLNRTASSLLAEICLKKTSLSELSEYLLPVFEGVTAKENITPEEYKRRADLYNQYLNSLRSNMLEPGRMVRG